MWEHNRAELMRRVKQALEHVRDKGRLQPSDLQLPIQLSPYPTAMQPLTGYEGGEFHPEKLGVTCIVVPPSEGRGTNSKGAWRLNANGGKKNTSESGLVAVEMNPRPHEGKASPDLPGKYIKFMLEKPPVDFLVPDPDAEPASNREPFVLMHAPKPQKQTRVAVPEPTTAVDEDRTPVDAPSTGPLDAGHVAGLVERLSLAGAASNSDGAGAGAGNLERALALKTEGNKHFSAGEYSRALPLYSEAIEMLEGAGEDAALATLLCNRSVAYLKASKPGSALTDADRARELGGGKAHYRLAEALSALGLTEEALEVYDAALATAQEGDKLALGGKIDVLKRGRVERATPEDFEWKLLHAVAGTTLLLAPGTYWGPFVIKVGVRIVGQGGVVFDSAKGRATLVVHTEMEGSPHIAGRVVLLSLDVYFTAGHINSHALEVLSGAVRPPPPFKIRSDAAPAVDPCTFNREASCVHLFSPPPEGAAQRNVSLI